MEGAGNDQGRGPSDLQEVEHTDGRHQRLGHEQVAHGEALAEDAPEEPHGDGADAVAHSRQRADRRREADVLEVWQPVGEEPAHAQCRQREGRCQQPERERARRLSPTVAHLGRRRGPRGGFSRGAGRRVVAVGQQSHLLGARADQQREGDEHGQRHGAKNEPAIAPAHRLDERLNGDGKEERAHGRPCRGDADGPAAASNEPLGHDGHRHHFAQRGHGQRAQTAEDQVEHPEVFHKLEQDEGAAEAERAHQHQEAGAVGLVLQGAQHRRKRSRGQRPHGERAIEGGPRPAEIVAHVRHEDAGAPDARAARERPAHDGNGHNHPAVVKPRLAST